MLHPLVVATVATIAVALVVRTVPPARSARATWREKPGPVCELSAATSTSYLRRDLAMVVAYAAARVDCKAAGWAGSHEPIVLGDMSQSDGGIPGTRQGLPRHPLATHVGGRDIDIAYYQRGTDDNHIRAICEHELAGIDQHHCVAPPNILDARRTALFLGSLLEESRIRAIGIDGAAAPPILAAFEQLCRDGWIRRYACRPEKIHYETAATGRGWYHFHHGHLHVSWQAPSPSRFR
jgi:hypothetical protein